MIAFLSALCTYILPDSGDTIPYVLATRPGCAKIDWLIPMPNRSRQGSKSLLFG
jgi:hypothetical protein